MTIRVYKPEDVRDMTKPVTLWAVWEGIDGRHHEKAYAYTPDIEIEHLPPRGRQYTSTVPGEHPLLTADYEEDAYQVLPGTLRFIRIEDVARLYRYVNKAGETVVFHWDGYSPAEMMADRVRTLNGFYLDQYDREYSHIFYPRLVDQDERLEPDEWADDYDKMLERSRHE